MVKVRRWMVDDGQVTLSAVGELMQRVGICASNARVIATGVGSASAMVGVRRSDEDQFRYRFAGQVMSAQVYEAQGRHGRSEYTSEVILETGDISLVVRSAESLDKFPIGGFVMIESALEVVAEYEWDDFAIPDVRADWMVRSVTPVWNAALSESDYLVDLRPASH